MTDDEYEVYAKSIGCKLSKHAPKVIMMIKDNFGSCPCKRNTEDNQLCPCPDHLQEIEDDGHCTCNLFEKVI